MKIIKIYNSFFKYNINVFKRNILDYLYLLRNKILKKYLLGLYFIHHQVKALKYDNYVPQ